MKIAILNGSPKVGNTAAMVNAFAEGAKAAGHIHRRDMKTLRPSV